MCHDVEDKGTGSPGFPTIESTFLGCHIILKVLENRAQEDPYGL